MDASLSQQKSRFHIACSQIIHLNDKLNGLQNRYDNAIRNKNATFRYSLRLRILVVERLLATYGHYASMVKDRIAALRIEEFTSRLQNDDKTTWLHWSSDEETDSESDEFEE